MNRRDALKTFAAVAAGGSLPVVATPLLPAVQTSQKLATLPHWRTWYVIFNGEPRKYRIIKLADEHGPAEFEAIT